MIKSHRRAQLDLGQWKWAESFHLHPGTEDDVLGEEEGPTLNEVILSWQEPVPSGVGKQRIYSVQLFVSEERVTKFRIFS